MLLESCHCPKLHLYLWFLRCRNCEIGKHGISQNWPFFLGRTLPGVCNLWDLSWWWAPKVQAKSAKTRQNIITCFEIQSRAVSEWLLCVRWYAALLSLSTWCEKKVCEKTSCGLKPRWKARKTLCCTPCLMANCSGRNRIPINLKQKKKLNLETGFQRALGKV